MTTSAAFGKNYWRAGVLWLFGSLTTYGASVTIGDSEALNALYISLIAGVVFVAVVWTVVLSTIPPKVGAHFLSIKYLREQCDVLGLYIDSGERLLMGNSALSKVSMDSWKDSVIDYLRGVNFDPSWPYRFSDISDLNVNRLTARTATRNLLVPATQEQEVLEIMKCYLMNLRGIRSGLYDALAQINIKSAL